jgi:hypothetical protein
MTKKEIRNTINKAVYEYVESLGYSIFDDGDGSCVTFVKGGYSKSDEAIEYHRSQHECYVLNWASDETKADAERIEEYVGVVKADVEMKVAIENGNVE